MVDWSLGLLGCSESREALVILCQEGVFSPLLAEINELAAELIGLFGLSFRSIHSCLLEWSLKDGLELLPGKQCFSLQKLVRSQQDLQILLLDLRHAHINQNEVHKHLTGHALHVRVILHKEHVKVHVYFLEGSATAVWSVRETLRDLHNCVLMHPAMLHDI